MIRLAIHGARGKMGARLCDLARGDARYELAAALDVGDAAPPSDTAIDLIIDVSSAAGAARAIEIASARGAAVLIATTGLLNDTLESARRAAAEVAVMIAPNTSVGVAVMKHIAARAAALLGEGYDISLIEYHHTQKIDAPSGTALAVAREIEAKTARKIPEKNLVGIRIGDVVGEHCVRFAGPSEVLEITHRASSRDLFVRGALRAGAWLAGREPGLYTIEEALGI